MDVSRAHGSIHGRRGVGHPRQHGHYHLRSSATIHGVLAPQQGDVANPGQTDQPAGTLAPQPADGSASLRYKRTERMGLVIQTQDGDTVRLRFRTSERLKAEISGASEGDGGSEISLAARTNSKISMSVKGDLSADELAAIHDTFNQAAALAGEFFSGGLSNAFAGAEALNIDAEQLARVSFKASVKQHLTYTSRGYAPTLPAQIPAEGEAPAEGSDGPVGEVPGGEVPSGEVPVEEGPAVEGPGDGAAGDEASVGVLSSEGAPSDAPVEVSEPEDGSFPDTALPGLDSEAGPLEGAEPAPTDPLQIIGDFLSRLAESFGANPDGGGTGSLNVSLKIRIFQSALITLSEAQPPEEPALPELVPETLDKVAELQQPPIDAVA